jgi:CheY-like chemotaxis protein
VEDSGPGVPPHLLHKIFEPFFTTKEVGTGTGLGLSIAHTLMTEHQGRIYHEKSPLGGAGFVLEFPVAKETSPPPKEAAPAEVAKPAASETARTGTILVLDDEKAIAEMLAEILGLLGYTPTVCNVPAQALDLIGREEFDMIISDFRMPGMNGRQFFDLAVLMKPELARRIIFLTGDVVNEDTQSFLKSIGNPHLAKPFNLDSIKAVVGQVIASVRQNSREPASDPAA